MSTHRAENSQRTGWRTYTTETHPHWSGWWDDSTEWRITPADDVTWTIFPQYEPEFPWDWPQEQRALLLEIYAKAEALAARREAE